MLQGSNLIDPSWTLKGPEDNMYFQHDQEITDDFLGRIADKRTAGANSREGELMEVCDIPVAVVEKWLREGFNIYEQSIQAILTRLSSEDLGHFITTHKSI